MLYCINVDRDDNSVTVINEITIKFRVKQNVAAITAHIENFSCYARETYNQHVLRPRALFC